MAAPSGELGEAMRRTGAGCLAVAGSFLALSTLAGCSSKPAAGPTFEAAAVQCLTTITSDPTVAFFSQPWPDDRRLASDGTVSTDAFPNKNGGTTLAATLMSTGDHLVHGWGTSAPAYLAFTGSIDPSTLPSDPQATGGSVYILNIDPTSPQLGQRALVDFNFYAAATSFLPGNVLAIRPVPGFPLQPKTTYAVVVTTAVKDTTGAAVGPEQAFWDVFVGQPQGQAEQQTAAFYQPLITELESEGVALSTIAGASIFTTQPILDEMLTLRDYLLSLPVPTFDPGTLQYDANLSVPATGSIPGYYVFEATYPATNMQHGTLPFAESGGDFEYDDAGVPIPGYVEHIRVSVVVPTTAEPDGGWPTAMYSVGTGSDYLGVVEEYEPVGPTIVEQGVAIFGIDPILTGPRSGLSTSAQATGCFGLPVADCFIDPVNAVAGRNNLRQAALDNVNLRQLISNPATVIPATAGPSTVAGFTNPLGHEITFNPAKLGFIGHSQGGLTGAIYLPIDPQPLGGVLSGAGGLVTATILERQDPLMLPIVEGPLFLNLPPGEALDWYHPALALIQTLAEAVDPINIARYWVNAPPTGGTAKSVLTTNGLLDADTPSNTAEFLNVAARLPQLLPLAHDSAAYDLSGIAPVSTPLSPNLSPADGGATVTAAFHQFPSPWNHFVIFDDRAARHQWSNFLGSLVTTGTATIPVDCTSCTCADGTCADSSGACDDGTSCTLCSVCECFENAGNFCPTDAAGDCGNGYPNCTRCNICFCDDDTCPTDATGDCDDGTNCLSPWIDAGMP